MASPVKVPLTLLVDGATVVFVALGVGVGEVDFVVVASGDADFVAAAVFVDVEFALLVAVEDFAGAVLCVVAGAVVAASVVVFETGAAGAVPIEREVSEEPSWGGVIARTAPSPPTVPPAINNARFISLLSLLSL
jgi:hypothetical protein